MEFMNCSRAAVLKLIHDGKLEAKKVGTEWRVTRRGIFGYLSGTPAKLGKAVRLPPRVRRLADLPESEVITLSIKPSPSQLPACSMSDATDQDKSGSGSG